MTGRRVEVGSKSREDHLEKMEKVLKKTQDPLLKAHISQLRKAWAAGSRLRKAA